MVKGISQEFAQDPWEFAQMLTHLRGAHRILEIGSRFGQSAYRMAEAAGAMTKVVMVDLPDDPYSQEKQLEDIRRRRNQIACLLNATLILGDSHERSTWHQVNEHAPFDFIFIDGDHTVEGVMKDWLDYGPLGTTVAFHDINNVEWGARTVWNKIKHEHTYAEYVRGDWGIGVIFKGVKRL